MNSSCQLTRSSHTILLLVLILGLPLLGTWLSGNSIIPFLHFPPRPPRIAPEEVSWILFICGSLTIVLPIAPFLWRMMTFSRIQSTKIQAFTFPAWGWLGVASLAIAWLIAWTRWPRLELLQPHTFTPLWLSYILLVNALTMMRTRHCVMMNQPKFFMVLFPLSAAFWWVFEYLNRFVQNWYYIPLSDLDALSYFFFATLPFSTVLPAIYGTYELLMSFPRVTDPFTAWTKVQIQYERELGWILILLSCLSLIGIGLWPTIFYPLIWISPLLMLVGLQILQGKDSILEYIRRGDWRPIVVPALAGLICGFFWELWNSQSLAHWEYAIPYLHVFQVFEMPLLGYAGYLPFGLECLALIQFYLPGRSHEETEEAITTDEPMVVVRRTWQTPSHHMRNT